MLTRPSPHRDAAARSAAAAHQYLALVPLLAAMPALERRSQRTDCLRRLAAGAEARGCLMA